MSNVIDFPASATIEINAGLVTSSFVIDATGTHPVPQDIGKHLFFVDVVEIDGGRMGMWSGSEYADARSEAVSLAKDFSGRIVDLSGGGV